MASASTSVARLDDPPVANQQGQDGTAGLRVNTAQLERPNLVGTGSGTEQQLLFNMDMERVNSAASSQVSHSLVSQLSVLHRPLPTPDPFVLRARAFADLHRLPSDLQHYS